MITLYGFGPYFGLPEASPFVIKTEVQLKMLGLAYAKQIGARDQSPKGQLPYLDDGETRIADSTFIRMHIEETYRVDLDAALDERQRAEAWVIERMVEHQLYWMLVHMRWVVPENFDRGPSHFFDAAPDAVRDQVRREAQARVGDVVYMAGPGRHALPEIVDLGTRSLSALSMLLGWKPYLMGDRPCAVDATAFGVLAGLLTPFFDSPLRDRASEFANLVAYVDRMMARYYPEHIWQPLKAAA